MVDVRNRDRPAKAAAKSVKALRSFHVEIEDLGVERVILQIFEQAPMKTVGPAFGGKSDVADLCEFCAVVESCDLLFRYALGRGVGVRSCIA